jgi:hypothetical protein
MTDEKEKLVPPAKIADGKKKEGLDGILQAGEKLIEDAKTKSGQVFVVSVIFLVCLIVFVFVIRSIF